MKTFNQFLIEGREGYLYHGTSIDTAEEIVQANSLQEGMFDPEHPAPGKGVSLTRSYDFAAEWKRGVVFVLDQDKLSRNYKIVPFNYFGKDPNVNKARRPQGIGNKFKFENQYEEFVTSPIRNLERYIVRIDVVKYTVASLYDVKIYLESAVPLLAKHPKLFYKGQPVNP